MKDEDHPTGLPSFRRMYLEISDPTEYRQATELLGGWEHWQALCSSKWFREFIEPLRDELEIKLRSEAVLNIMLIKNSDRLPQALQASKWIANGDYKEGSRVGRPTRDDSVKEALIAQEIAKNVEDDYLRIVSDNSTTKDD